MSVQLVLKLSCELLRRARWRSRPRPKCPIKLRISPSFLYIRLPPHGLGLKSAPVMRGQGGFYKRRKVVWVGCWYM